MPTPRSNRFQFFVLVAACALAACESEGNAGSDALVEVTAEPAGDNCPAGGQRVEAGIDDDADGELDVGSTKVAFICNGEPGDAGEAGDAAEPGERGEPGESGELGPRGESGAEGDKGDDGDDGDKGDDGDTGSTGAPGSDGASTLIEITAERPGVHCYEGGHRIDAGLDLDGDGMLDDGDVTTIYVCNGQDADAELEIAGTWHEIGPWGGIRTMTTETLPFGAHVVEFDNDDNWVITQYPADDLYNPNKFGKTFWTRYEHGGFYYCTAEYSLDTLEEAQSSQNIPDPSDLETCGAGTWSQLIEVIELEGRWHSMWGGTSAITSGAFLYGDEILQVDNEANYVITRTPEDAEYFPGQLARSHWTERQDGSFWYCTIEYDLDTIEEARTLTHVPNDGDPANSGCGPFSWTLLSTPIEVEGSWQIDGSDAAAIDSDAWADALERAVVEYDNEANRAILQNPSDAPVGADLYQVVVWTELAADAFYLCVVDPDLATLQEAHDSTATADAQDLVTGCNGGAWALHEVAE